MHVALFIAAIAALSAMQSIGPDSYQVFIEGWTPSNAPLCAVVDSPSRWSALFHPAPVMGRNRPFAPQASFFKQQAILVVARVVPGGATSHVFALTPVARVRNVLVERYRFTPTLPASFTMRWWSGVAISRPLPRSVEFVENGRRVCDLDLAHGDWRSP